MLSLHQHTCIAACCDTFSQQKIRLEAATRSSIIILVLACGMHKKSLYAHHTGHSLTVGYRLLSRTVACTKDILRLQAYVKSQAHVCVNYLLLLVLYTCISYLQMQISCLTQTTALSVLSGCHCQTKHKSVTRTRPKCCLSIIKAKAHINLQLADPVMRSFATQIRRSAGGR